MPRLAMRLGARPRMSRPAKRTFPEAGTRPVMALHSVDLPMPLRPTMASTPWSSASDTPCSTWARPKWTSSLSTWRTGVALPAMAASVPGAHVDGLDLGIVLDLVGRAVLQQAAVVQDGDALDDAQRDVEIVLDQHIAHMGRERRQQRHQLPTLRRGESGGRLVEQDEPRRAGQRHADLELAELAVRQFRDQIG